MAPKKPTKTPSSFTQKPSTKKDKPKRSHPSSYSSQYVKKRVAQFQKRSLIPLRFMHEPTLKAIGCFDEVKELFLRAGLYDLAFTPLPSYPTLIVEFLSTITLHSVKYDDENPYFSMHFKLGGRDRFMTHQEFDTLFGFSQEGHIHVQPNWLFNAFWNKVEAPQSPHFSAGHTKASHLKSKVLWYDHWFLTYSINGRALSNENFSLDDLFILHCLVDNEPITLG